MSNEEFIVLAEKVANGKANSAELALYSTAYDSFQHDYINQSMLPTNIEDLEKLSLRKLRENLGLESKKVKLWPRVSVASAAMIATMLFGIWFFRTPLNTSSVKSELSQQIVTGRNGAQLTLSNGKVIELKDVKNGVAINQGQFIYTDGTLVSEGSGITSEEKEVVEIIASTTNGQTYVFTLPDGSKVWLNSASQLKFPSSFSSGVSRYVELKGEAYFEVFKDKTRPFVVVTQEGNGIPRQEITVLGTHFNVNAYADEHLIKTTLLHGSVRVKGNNSASVILKPNQQSQFAVNGLKVIEVDPAPFVAWKDGIFQFEQQNVYTIMKQIGRWYNVDVVFKDKVPDLHFDGRISRATDLNTVLEIIQSTGKVSFKIEGRRIIVMK